MLLTKGVASILGVAEGATDSMAPKFFEYYQAIKMFLLITVTKCRFSQQRSFNKFEVKTDKSGVGNKSACKFRSSNKFHILSPKICY